MLSVNSCISAWICDNLSSISFGCWYHCCCYLSSWELFTYVTKWESALPLVPYSAIINPWEFFSAPQLQEPQKDSRVCVLPSPRFLVIQICFRMFGDGTVTLTTQISLTAEIRTSNIPHAIRLLYMFHYWPILSLNLVICLWS